MILLVWSMFYALLDQYGYDWSTKDVLFWVIGLPFVIIFSKPITFDSWARPTHT